MQFRLYIANLYYTVLFYLPYTATNRTHQDSLATGGWLSTTIKNNTDVASCNEATRCSIMTTTPMT